MNKKDFIALADSMRDFLATNAGREMDENSQNCLLQHMVWFCERQNPRFNRGRWLDYVAGKCGKNGGAVKKAA